MSDGQYRQEEVRVVNQGTDDEHIVVTGRYSFIGTDGVRYEVNYVADKNGYRVAPPTPSIGAAGGFAPQPLGIDPNLVKSLFG